MALPRRRFFYRLGQGLGSVALPWLINTTSSPAATAADGPPTAAHLLPRAKNVIYLFMVGGPSQLDMFDYKPVLAKYAGEPLPESLRKYSNFAQIKEREPKIFPSPWSFSRFGDSGRYVSELMPHFGKIVDEVAIIRTVKTKETVHPFAEMLFNTGYREYGKPSMGAWVTYGLGTESKDFPAYIVMQSGSRLRAKGANYSNGFLPPSYQGVPLRDGSEPILNLQNPAGVSSEHQRDVVQAVAELNNLRSGQLGDTAIEARTRAYELAFRMQSSAPELMDLRGESPATLASYGVDPSRPSFSRNCLIARRLVEKGVRFVQLFHGDWDHHGDIASALPNSCRDVDQACAALVIDLKQRGLLDDTLVIFAGEFGRTSVAQQQVSGSIGRDHHIEAFSIWLAGGGVRSGYTFGATDELGVYATENSVDVHDLHATILYALGLDHEHLTYRFQGRDFRLTDVYGNVRQELFV
ncbi:MAG: DUF1501 domain-containing protein [Planctomycetota bacterium]